MALQPLVRCLATDARKPPTTRPRFPLVFVNQYSVLITQNSLVRTYSLPQHFCRMLRFPTCQMFDLLAARNTRCNDLNIASSRLDRGSQAAIANRERQIVVLLFEAERTGHAAAARIDFADFEACRL